MSDAQLRDDLRELTGIIRELSGEVRQSREDRRSSNSSSIRIDAGGASAWFSSKVAAICCAFLVGLSVGLTGMVVMGWIRLASVEASANANKAYLSAIFQRQPGLKAELDTAKEPKK